MFSSDLHDTIFVDFIHSMRYDGDQRLVEDSIREIQSGYKESPVKKSNKGGWQSILYEGYTCGSENLNTFVNKCFQSISDWCVKSYGRKLNHINWWFNINKKGNFNSVHNHGRADLVAVYYVKAPKNSGTLSLSRNDGSAYTTLFEADADFELTPEEGRLYFFPAHIWHWVDCSESDEERISISMNLKV